MCNDANIFAHYKLRLRFNVESLVGIGMEIFKDEVVQNLVDHLRNSLRRNVISTRKDSSLSAPRFVFVCGKKIAEEEESIRGYTMKKLNMQKVQNDYGSEYGTVLCIISEYLYIQDLAEDIFVFEKMLAEISDKIIIITESPGTFCELGAFVMDEQCRKKTVVINENNENFKSSFITRGPIKLLENEHPDRVILHNGLERIKESLEYNYKVQQIANEEFSININKDANEIHLKSLIYELTNIIELFQPIEPYEVEYLYKGLKKFSSYQIHNTAGHKIRTIKQVLFLMEKMKLVRKEKGYYFINNGMSCYNVMFSISRKEFNQIRIEYLNRLNNCKSERMDIL